MDNFTFYQICYKTLSDRTIETNILFKRLPDAHEYIKYKNNPETNWGTKYFVKAECIHLYSTYTERAKQEEKDRQR